MRCSECGAWSKPDTVLCPVCGLGVSTPMLDYYVKQVETAHEDAGPDEEDDWLENAADETESRIEARLRSRFEGRGRARRVTAEAAAVEAPVEQADSTAFGAVAVDAKSQGVLNLLLLHSGFSPFTSVAVRRSPPGDLGGLSLEVTAIPPVLIKKSIALDEYEQAPDPPIVAPDVDAFWRLDEAVRGQLELAVRDAQETLQRRTFQVTVQAPNEWINQPGVEAALACVVTPNATAVAAVFDGIGADFSAYQSGDMDNVRREISSIYEAVRDLGLRYNGVPPSFEGSGQKVLFPDEVIAQRQGCCIDIAVLTAALLERANYHPLVILVQGHAFTGVWTSQIQSQRPVIRDLNAIRSYIGEAHLIVWNSTTYFDHEADTSFEAAENIGQQMLARFEYALDIAACRAHRFREFKPLPRRMS